MYVRAIYIPLCKKISSSSSQTLPFCLFPPIHPFSTLLKFLPSFPSLPRVVTLVSATRTPINPTFWQIASVFIALEYFCGLEEARASPRLPGQTSSSRFSLDSPNRDREGSPSEILEVWIFVWMFFFEGKVGKREFSAPSSRMEGRSKRLDENDGKVKVKEKAERFFWGWLRVN